MSAGSGWLSCGLGVVLVLASWTPAAWGAPALRDLVAQGNAEFAAGRYREALDLYERAAQLPGGADSVELLHNRAAAHFKLGQRNEARELWARARERGDASLEARMRYNLGNLEYAEALDALQQPQPGVEAAQEHLARAVEQYRGALRLDPSLSDARANLELSHQLRRQLEEMRQNQPQTGGSDQQSGEQQDESNQDRSEQSNNQQQREQPPQSPQQSDQGQDQPSSESQQDESGQDKSQEKPQDEQSGQQDQDEQQSQDQAPSQADRDQAGQSEQQQADAAGDAPAGSAPRATPEPPAGERESAQDRMTDQQAERLLQMVRDAEKARREELARRRMSRTEPAEKDW